MQRVFPLCFVAVAIAGTAFSRPATAENHAEARVLLQKHCVSCHNATDRKGDVILDRSPVTVGDLSLLLEVIAGPDASMPKDRKPLPASDVNTLKRWINAGAPIPQGRVLQSQNRADSSWWSLQPIADTTPPDGMEAGDSYRLTNPIDRFVRAKLMSAGLSPSPLADRRTLIRRLYFDLTGLPPTPAEVSRFVGDTDPLAYERLVDRLLESKHFGERWARHWLDIAHYADTHGFERDKLRENAWRYRDYVIRAFNDDKAYDRFLLEQIAGDVIDPENSDAVVATGFLAAGPWDFVGQVETKSSILRRSARALDLDDMVTQVMAAATAMTVNCARCHDHKLDPITQQEYYQLVAVFAGLKRDNRVISEEALERYQSETKRLDRQIDENAFAIGTLQGRPLDLADVVGGGNGFGTGDRGSGLDARSGRVQERPFGDLGNVKPGRFSKCDFAFIDGVFVPAAGETQISSTKLTATGLPENGGKAWDMIRNGPVSSQFSTKLGKVDYNSDGHSMIGLHANAGITFDLAAIRAARVRSTADDVHLNFSAVVGYGGRTVSPSAEFRVLLDGIVKAQARIGRNDAIEINLGIPVAARFLTLISTDGGNGYGHDQISFGDPRLTSGETSTPADSATQKRLASLEDRQRALLRARKALGHPPEFFGVVAEDPPDVHVLTRGNPETPGAQVVPGTLGWGDKPVVFGAANLAEADRRTSLAKWIVDPANPLTPRVIVNRLWHWHFGQGIVNTPSDFGYGGSKPSHPELLDWLAGRLIAEDWSLKAIHRLIVTSETYRQESTSRDKAAQIDAGNRLLWRMNPRRLEAEAIRDSVLSVTGKLNPEMFGPGYRDFEYAEAYAPIYRYVTADSPVLWRRSVYRFLVRTTPQQFMTALDCPDPANLTPMRNVTTTPLQSLALFNNDFMLRQAGYFAERLERDAGRRVDHQIAHAFNLAFSRGPGPAEARHAAAFIERNGLLQFCRALLNANEFVYID